MYCYTTSYLISHHIFSYTIGSVSYTCTVSGHTISYTVGYIIGYSVSYIVNHTICYAVGYSVSYTVNHTIGYSVGYSVSYTIGYSASYTVNHTICYTVSYTDNCTISLSSYTLRTYSVSYIMITQLGIQSSPVITPLNQTWLQVGSHKLTLNDQMILINGGELNDHHVNFSQYLLHNQFPLLKGLRLTLLQEKPLKDKLPTGSIQIIHNNRRHHWLVATTMNCCRNEVKINDSLFNAKVRRIVKNIFHTTRNPSFVMVKMQSRKALLIVQHSQLQLQRHLPMV